MRAYINKTLKYGMLIVLGSVLGACNILPAAGPSVSDIRASSVENGGNSYIVPVTAKIITAATRSRSLGFSASFVSAGPISVDVIRSGDTLAITVWENVDNGLFSTLGKKVTTLPGMEVDQLGNIFMPYVGTVKVSGRTLADVREKLTELLKVQTPDPQVEVRRTTGEGASVSIIGGVGAQGVYPIEAATRDLSGMLARAGGVTLDPRVVKITIKRGQQVGSIWLQDLYDNSNNDIQLKAGDKIILEADERYFVALGTTSQRRVEFETHNPSAIEALALIGGLRSYSSDPRGVFIFREEPASVANRVLGRTDLISPQEIVYVIDITEPSGVFTAQNFEIRNEDIIYTTEAPYVTWTKLVGVVISSLNSVTSLDGAVSGIAGILE